MADYSALVAAVSFNGVITALLSIGVLLVAVFAALYAVAMVRQMLAGESVSMDSGVDYKSEGGVVYYRDSESNGQWQRYS